MPNETTVSTSVFDDTVENNPNVKKSVKDWLQDIKESERILEAEERKWNRFKKYYKNEFHTYRSDDDRITVNYIYAIAKSLIPQLYFKNPKIFVNTRRERSGIPTKLNPFQQSGNPSR